MGLSAPTLCLYPQIKFALMPFRWILCQNIEEKYGITPALSFNLTFIRQKICVLFSYISYGIEILTFRKPDMLVKAALLKRVHHGSVKCVRFWCPLAVLTELQKSLLQGFTRLCRHI